jgi:hypothetical protein
VVSTTLDDGSIHKETCSGNTSVNKLICNVESSLKRKIKSIEFEDSHHITDGKIPNSLNQNRISETSSGTTLPPFLNLWQRSEWHLSSTSFDPKLPLSNCSNNNINRLSTSASSLNKFLLVTDAVDRDEIKHRIILRLVTPYVSLIGFDQYYNTLHSRLSLYQKYLKAGKFKSIHIPVRI